MRLIMSVLLLMYSLSWLSPCCLSPAVADPNAEERAAIEHLLEHLRTSNLTFVRNGDRHDGASAAHHIEGKYMSAKKNIQTADDFIKLAATRSNLTGEAYQVILSDGTTKFSADFLKEELARYRQAQQKK